jgi:hypothetical protein
MEFMHKAWFENEDLLAPVVDFSWGVHQIPEEREPVHGLNVGPRLLTRKMLRQIGGWDEACDGSRGRDDETIDLCLEVLLQKEYDLVRYRHPDLVIHKVPHKNGTLPLRYDPPWSHPEEPPRNRLRCNLSFAHHIAYQRYESENYRANTAISVHDIPRLREPCDISRLHHTERIPNGTLLQANRVICACHRGDREQQLESYITWRPPDIPALMDAFDEEFSTQFGCFDPWLILMGRPAKFYNVARHLQDEMRKVPPIMAHTTGGHTTKGNPE